MPLHGAVMGGGASDSLCMRETDAAARGYELESARRPSKHAWNGLCFKGRRATKGNQRKAMRGGGVGAEGAEPV